jgi:hypothetical protein
VFRWNTGRCDCFCEQSVVCSSQRWMINSPGLECTSYMNQTAMPYTALSKFSRYAVTPCCRLLWGAGTISHSVGRRIYKKRSSRRHAKCELVVFDAATLTLCRLVEVWLWESSAVCFIVCCFFYCVFILTAINTDCTASSGSLLSELDLI